MLLAVVSLTSHGIFPHHHAEKSETAPHDHHHAERSHHHHSPAETKDTPGEDMKHSPEFGDVITKPSDYADFLIKHTSLILFTTDFRLQLPLYVSKEIMHPPVWDQHVYKNEREESIPARGPPHVA
jgi:hypothetical protein